jgi:hypothetical protein
MKTGALVLAVAVMLPAVVSGLGQAKPSLKNLSWLAGCWEGRRGEVLIEEHWSKPAGHSMLAFSRTISNDKLVSYEFVQLREDGDGLVYMPQPQGGQRVSFRLVQFLADKYVFENLAHDFPQRITYERRKGGALLASIEGVLKGKPEREEFLLKHVRCVEPGG